MIPQKVTDIAEEYADSLGDLVGIPRYTIERLNDIERKEVYIVQCNLLPEHRGICIGPSPILIGKGSHFRRPAQKEEALIYQEICRNDSEF